MNRMLLVAVLAVIGWVRLPVELKGQNDCPTDVCMGYTYGENALMYLFVEDTKVVALSMSTTYDISDADWKETTSVTFDYLWTFASPTQAEWDCLMDTNTMWDSKTCGRIIYSARANNETFTEIWNWEYRGLPITTEL